MVKMDRTYVLDTLKKIGQKATILGRVQTVRDHGKVTFLDIFDETGIVQAVTRTQPDISSQDIVEITGTVKKRPENLINKNMPTGEIEIEFENLKIISKSQTPPIPTEGDGYEIEEENRLKYRYLDLRRQRMQKNLRLRHKIVSIVREYLNGDNFVEIETPYLSKTTPEGARDFVVPSRLNPGKFYALTQAPQQYKQLLMLSNFEKYYQIARAFRDEDLRSDRQFEHTQIDIEMAYVSRQDIINLMEGLMSTLSKALNLKVIKKPFPVFTYSEALKKFGKDKFDLRSEKQKKEKELAFAWVVDFPLFEFDEKQNRYTFSHNPFTAPKEEDLKNLKNKKNLKEISSYQYDLVLNGEELGSGSIRITDPSIQREVFSIMGMDNKKIEKDFGHLLSAYEYGAPSHGGIAIGLDRLCAILAGESNIREVIAFPTSGSGQTSVMDAPAEIDSDTLRELKIRTQ